jgi:hypothetical protein
VLPDNLMKNLGSGNELATVTVEQQGEDQEFPQSPSCYVMHREGPKLINSKTRWVDGPGHGFLSLLKGPRANACCFIR